MEEFLLIMEVIVWQEVFAKCAVQDITLLQAYVLVVHEVHMPHVSPTGIVDRPVASIALLASTRTARVQVNA